MKVKKSATNKDANYERKRGTAAEVRHRKLESKPSANESKICLPLVGKSVYLDVPGYRGAKTLEQDLLLLGAKLESFLSREIRYIISNNEAAKEKARVEYQSQDEEQMNVASPTGVSTPSPFNMAEGNYPSVAPADTRTKTQMTRGKAMVRNAKVNSQASLLDNAVKWGVRIVHLEGALKWVEREKNKLKLGEKAKPEQPTTATAPKRSSLLHKKLRQLAGPYLKFESESCQYRPISQTLTAWPQVNLTSPTGSCPFDGLFLGQGKNANDVEAAQRDIIMSSISEKDERRTPEFRKPRSADVDSVGLGLGNVLTAGEAKLMRIKQRRAERKKGYCECCMLRYNNIDHHVRGEEHKTFVRATENFVSLDRLISGATSIQFLEKLINTRRPATPSLRSDIPNSSSEIEEIVLLLSPMRHLRNTPSKNSAISPIAERRLRNTPKKNESVSPSRSVQLLNTPNKSSVLSPNRDNVQLRNSSKKTALLSSSHAVQVQNTKEASVLSQNHTGRLRTTPKKPNSLSASQKLCFSSQKCKPRNNSVQSDGDGNMKSTINSSPRKASLRESKPVLDKPVIASEESPSFTKNNLVKFDNHCLAERSNRRRFSGQIGQSVKLSSVSASTPASCNVSTVKHVQKRITDSGKIKKVYNKDPQIYVSKVKLSQGETHKQNMSPVTIECAGECSKSTDGSTVVTKKSVVNVVDEKHVPIAVSVNPMLDSSCHDSCNKSPRQEKLTMQADSSVKQKLTSDESPAKRTRHRTTVIKSVQCVDINNVANEHNVVNNMKAPGTCTKKTTQTKNTDVTENLHSARMSSMPTCISNMETSCILSSKQRHCNASTSQDIDPALKRSPTAGNHALNTEIEHLHSSSGYWHLSTGQSSSLEQDKNLDHGQSTVSTSQKHESVLQKDCVSAQLRKSRKGSERDRSRKTYTKLSDDKHDSSSSISNNKSNKAKRCSSIPKSHKRDKDSDTIRKHKHKRSHTIPVMQDFHFHNVLDLYTGAYSEHLKTQTIKLDERWRILSNRSTAKLLEDSDSDTHTFIGYTEEHLQEPGIDLPSDISYVDLSEVDVVDESCSSSRTVLCSADKDGSPVPVFKEPYLQVSLLKSDCLINIDKRIPDQLKRQAVSDIQSGDPVLMHSDEEQHDHASRLASSLKQLTKGLIKNTSEIIEPDQISGRVSRSRPMSRCRDQSGHKDPSTLTATSEHSDLSRSINTQTNDLSHANEALRPRQISRPVDTSSIPENQSHSRSPRHRDELHTRASPRTSRSRDRSKTRHRSGIIDASHPRDPSDTRILIDQSLESVRLKRTTKSHKDKLSKKKNGDHSFLQYSTTDESPDGYTVQLCESGIKLTFSAEKSKKKQRRRELRNVSEPCVSEEVFMEESIHVAECQMDKADEDSIDQDVLRTCLVNIGAKSPASNASSWDYVCEDFLEKTVEKQLKHQKIRSSVKQVSLAPCATPHTKSKSEKKLSQQKASKLVRSASDNSRKNLRKSSGVISRQSPRATHRCLAENVEQLGKKFTLRKSKSHLKTVKSPVLKSPDTRSSGIASIGDSNRKSRTVLFSPRVSLQRMSMIDVSNRENASVVKNLSLSMSRELSVDTTVSAHPIKRLDSETVSQSSPNIGFDWFDLNEFPGMYLENIAEKVKRRQRKASVKAGSQQKSENTISSDESALIKSLQSVNNPEIAIVGPQIVITPSEHSDQLYISHGKCCTSPRLSNKSVAKSQVDPNSDTDLKEHSDLNEVLDVNMLSPDKCEERVDDEIVFNYASPQKFSHIDQICLSPSNGPVPRCIQRASRMSPRCKKQIPVENDEINTDPVSFVQNSGVINEYSNFPGAENIPSSPRFDKKRTSKVYSSGLAESLCDNEYDVDTGFLSGGTVQMSPQFKKTISHSPSPRQQNARKYVRSVAGYSGSEAFITKKHSSVQSTPYCARPNVDNIGTVPGTMKHGTVTITDNIYSTARSNEKLVRVYPSVNTKLSNCRKKLSLERESFNRNKRELTVDGDRDCSVESSSKRRLLHQGHDMDSARRAIYTHNFGQAPKSAIPVGSRERRLLKTKHSKQSVRKCINPSVNLNPVRSVSQTIGHVCQDGIADYEDKPHPRPRMSSRDTHKQTLVTNSSEVAPTESVASLATHSSDMRDEVNNPKHDKKSSSRSGRCETIPETVDISNSNYYHLEVDEKRITITPSIGLASNHNISSPSQSVMYISPDTAYSRLRASHGKDSNFSCSPTTKNRQRHSMFEFGS